MIQSVDRALRILTVLQGDHRLSLGEIAQRLDLPPSTVHGIVRTLLAHRMVVQEHDSGQYRLGPAVLTLGNVYLDTLELRSRVAPWAEDLARRTGLAVRTAVMLARRRRRRAPRAPARRVSADARGRHRDPRPRLARSARRSWRSTRRPPRACSTADRCAA